MNLNLFELSCLPIMLAVLSIVLAPLSLMRVAIAVGYWIELGIAAMMFRPVLDGSVALLVFNEDFAVDRLGACFILLTILVVASAITHADCYFAAEEKHLHGHENTLQVKSFYFFTNLFLLAMCAVFMCNNLGFLWISVEATTLCSAPLVYFDRTKNALEATWKYLIICSVGIALALLGTVFIFASSQHGAFAAGSLNIDQLQGHAKELNYSLLRLGFIFSLLGYGTKAGIFPLHSWLPDAHSEAPAPASAMLSGALLNCALFAIWKVSRIVYAAGHPGYVSELALVMGAITVVAASLFLIRQHSFKRMWAYSSIENVGIMLIAIGLGSPFLFFLQALNHSLAKVTLFLISGNIVQACGTKRLHQLHGLLKSSPLWGVLLTVATFAVTGMPPFGSFVSEIWILTNSAGNGNWGIVCSLLVALAIALVAVSTHVGRVLFGGPKANFAAFQPVRASVIPTALMVGSLLLGLLIGPNFGMGF
jgi:hydrogenase-4 component F